MKQYISLFAVLFLVACASKKKQELEFKPGASACDKVTQIIRKGMKDNNIPAISASLVRKGKIECLIDEGYANLTGPQKLKPKTAFPIASISKQFVAASALILEERGKLSLNERLSKYFPKIKNSRKVKLHQLLDHTSGYQDYWPQDFTPVSMTKDTTPKSIIKKWASGQKLDFVPGSEWQYSNTGYVIMGQVIEKVSGMTLFAFMKKNIFVPLKMKSVQNYIPFQAAKKTLEGYTQYGFGPLRPFPRMGKSWMYAAGQLVMSAEDLAKWNISVMNRTLLKPRSYRKMQREVVLSNGLSTSYGLGVAIGAFQEKRFASHGGMLTGFTSRNIVFPDDKVSFSILVNRDGSGFRKKIFEVALPHLFEKNGGMIAKKEQRVKSIFRTLQKGQIDRSAFTKIGNEYYTNVAIKEFSESLKPYGSPEEVVQTYEKKRGGMTLRMFDAKFGGEKLLFLVREMPDGKLEEFIVMKND